VARTRRWPSERRSFTDPVSGVKVTQLTDYKGHSHHLYSTNPGWYDAGRRLLFGSDRGNCTNLFSVDLDSGAIQQLTDYPAGRPGVEESFQNSFKNPARDEVYYVRGRELTALDLRSCRARAAWRLPDGFVPSMLGVTADGTSVAIGISEDLSGRFRVDLGHGYVGFEETWAAHPLSRIMLVPVDGGPPRVAHEERAWVGHVNPSPTNPRWLTFCHEGPWYKVDNRIWTLDLSSGETRMLRPRRASEMVGHEYWHADGVHVGYHGWADAADYLARRAEGRKLFGRVRFDGTDVQEVDFPHETGHIHSNDFTLVVGDGSLDSPFVRLWRWNGSGFDGPRVLCEHRCSSHSQKAHVHPRFSPDGKSVLFTSDRSDYGNVYVAEVPPFESLTELPPRPAPV
jgi:oligogalacturonide lyase